MIESLQANIVTIVLALISTGTVALIVKSYFGVGTTKSQAKKTDAEAAVILLEGWEKIAQTLKEQMKDMEGRYESRIVAFERRIEIREKWYTENLASRDRKIEKLQEQVWELKQRLSHYEDKQFVTGSQFNSKVQSAKEDLKDDVEQRLEGIKK